MRKMRLELDALAVDTFAPREGAPTGAGTVRAHSDLCTRGEWTCRFHATCSPLVDCVGSDAAISCPGDGPC